MKRFKKIIIIIFSVFLFLILAAIVLAKVYEDKIVGLVTAEINKNLVTEITVDDIEFSFIRKFPNASVRFKNLVSKDVSQYQSDTLFAVQSLFLEFDIRDIIKKEYNVKKLSIEHGFVRPKVDREGNDNYHFWKPSTDSTSSSFNLALQKVDITDIRFDYRNAKADRYVETLLNNVELQGDFSDSAYTLSSKGKLNIEKFYSQSAFFAAELPTEYQLKLDVKNNTFSVTQGNIELDKLPFALTGELTESDMNFELNAEKLDLDKVLKRLPENSQEKLENYTAKGTVSINTKITGDRKESPIINSTYTLVDGSFKEKKTGITLSNLSLNGSYTNGSKRELSTSEISITKLSGKTKSGSISGSFSVKNLVSPLLTLDIDLDTELEELVGLAGADSIKNVKGRINGKVNFKNQFKSFDDIGPKDYAYAKVSGDLILKDVEFEYEDSPLEFNSINANMAFTNRDVLIKSLSGNISESDFYLEGFFRNSLYYLLFPDEKITIEAKLKSDQIRLSQLLQSKKSNKKDEYNLTFSKRLEFVLDAKIKKLDFQEFEGTDIAAIFTLKDQKFSTNRMHFNTMEGEANGTLKVNGQKEGVLLVASEAKFKNINVKELFHDFDNFGQKTLQHENISGTSSATVSFNGEWSNALVTNLDKIEVKADVEIDNGQLIEFKTLEALSDFVDIKELEKVSFSNLKNSVEIKNQTIIIPKMDIETSAMNLSGYGKHYFDNRIEYHIQVEMSDIFYKDKKKKSSDLDEFVVVADDGVNHLLFLKITGTVDDPKVSYDLDHLGSDLKRGWKKQGEELKNIFNPKDSVDNTKKDNGLIIEWDEDDTDTTSLEF